MIINDLFEHNDICKVCGQTPCNCTHIIENSQLNEVDPRNFDSDEDYYAALKTPAKQRSQLTPRRHPDDADFMDPDQRRLRADQERVRKANAEYFAKQKQQGVAEAVWDRPSQSYVPRDGRTFGQTNHPREEHCDACGAATGHAGPGEDSNVDDEGNVYCDDCYADQKGVAEGSDSYTVANDPDKPGMHSYREVGHAVQSGHSDAAKIYKNNKFLGTVGDVRKQGMSEGLGKDIKRAAQGWGGAQDKPADIVKRNKSYDTDTAKKVRAHLDDAPDHTPAGLQKRVLDRKLKGVAEGSIGDKIKGAAKSIKRAVQWDSGPEMVTPAGTVKAFKNMDGQHLANFVASRKELSTPKKGSARAFADKVIDREMKQRGYGRVAGNGEQGVSEAEQQKGADYRDPKEADYGDDYQDMVARVKKLAGLGPLKTVYDPAKRVYKNVPTAVQPKK